MTPTISFILIAFLVLPQWVLMIVQPHSIWTQKLVASDIIPFCLLLIFIGCVGRIEAFPLTFHSLDSLLQVFSLDNIALAAWAFLGFLSLVISGWVFERVKEWDRAIEWASYAVSPRLVVLPVFIWLIVC